MANAEAIPRKKRKKSSKKLSHSAGQEREALGRAKKGTSEYNLQRKKKRLKDKASRRSRGAEGGKPG